MTTTVIVRPHGHNADAILTEMANREFVQTVVPLDPHGETAFSVYDGKTVLIREREGWAPPPDAPPP